jgi:hypothetical protein
MYFNIGSASLIIPLIFYVFWHSKFKIDKIGNVMLALTFI